VTLVGRRGLGGVGHGGEERLRGREAALRWLVAVGGRPPIEAEKLPPEFVAKTRSALADVSLGDSTVIPPQFSGKKGVFLRIKEPGAGLYVFDPK